MQNQINNMNIMLHECNQCTRKYRYASSLRRHVNASHVNGLQENSGEHRVFFSPKTMTRYEDLDLSVESPVFMCKNCTKTLMSEEAARHHLTICSVSKGHKPTARQQSMARNASKVTTKNDPASAQPELIVKTDPRRCECCDLPFESEITMHHHIKQTKLFMTDDESSSDSEYE